MRDILKYGLILMVVAAFSAGSLAIVYKATEGKRKEVLEEEKRNALLEVLPQAKVFEPVIKEDSILFYIGYETENKKAIAGYACIAEGEGYSSTIRTMVGITPEGVITGLKVLNQKETPGLGARVEEVETSKTLRDVFRRGLAEEGKDEEKPWFQAQFVGEKAGNLHVENMDTITGATITSEAVIKSVREKIEKLLLEVEKGKLDPPYPPY